MYWQKKVAPAPPLRNQKKGAWLRAPRAGAIRAGQAWGMARPQMVGPQAVQRLLPHSVAVPLQIGFTVLGLDLVFFFFGSLKSYICTPTMRRSKVRFARRGHDASLRRQSRQGLRSRWASIRFYCRALRTSILRSGDFYCRDFLIIILFII